MTNADTAITSTPPDREVASRLATPNRRHGLVALLTSAPPYVCLSVIVYLTLSVSPVLTAALEILTAGFLVRVFVMFHDCSHNSLFPSRRANALWGISLGLLVLTPFRRWQHDHAVHHATAGDLDRRGIGDVVTLTVSEYRARSPRDRAAYRFVRNPLVMFGLGPIFAMVIGPRLVARGTRRRLRNSVLGTDLALIALLAACCWVVGWRDFLIVWGPPAMLAGAVGIWLFYVQHQFEDAYWERRSEWTFDDAALHGSSYLQLPSVLRFFTGNIGFHHVHHFNARIPHYNLPLAHRAISAFGAVPTLTISDGLKALRLKLWDEQAEQLVTFREARRCSVPAASSLGRI